MVSSSRVGRDFSGDSDVISGDSYESDSVDSRNIGIVNNDVVSDG